MSLQKTIQCTHCARQWTVDLSTLGQPLSIAHPEGRSERIESFRLHCTVCAKANMLTVTHRVADAPEDIIVANTRAEAPEEAELANWFDDQESKSFDRLKAGATAITQLITILYAVSFGFLLFINYVMPSSFQSSYLRAVGVIIGSSWLIALLAALYVLLPSRSTYIRVSIAEERTVYSIMLRRKHWGLVIAVAAFGVGQVIFALLIIGMLSVPWT
jgi:hypothetical protein